MTGKHANEPAPTGVVLVQPGWQIHSRDGVMLGEVIAIDERLMHIRLEGGDEQSLELGVDTIIEQSDSEMRARISLTADQLDTRAG